MGLAKYYEDNIEIIDERKYERIVARQTTKAKIYYDCYYCNKSFESVNLRNSHIKSWHNVVGPLLFINGKIASSQYYVDKVKSAKIVLCGFNPTNISLNKQLIKSDSPEIDLKTYFKSENGNYTINIDQKVFKIFKYTSSNITNLSIDGIINKWESQVDQDLPLDSLGISPNSLNKAEVRYLNGFKEYFTACSSNISPINRSKRYKAAYAILSSFNTLPPKARVILKVIAFRWNWIEKLENLCGISSGIFNVVVDFYKRKSDQKNSTNTIGAEYQIFIEADIADCLNAIIAYQFENWSEVNNYLTKWTDAKITAVADKNKKDRILLLKARRLIDDGRQSEAIRYYNDIRTPFFRTEAMDYSKNKRIR